MTPSGRPGGSAASSSAECNPGAGVPSPYCCFPQGSIISPVPQEGPHWGRGSQPVLLFPAESTSPSLPPQEGLLSRTKTNPVEMHEQNSEIASLLFLLWRWEASDKEVSPSPYEGVLNVSRLEREPTPQPTQNH